jgi:hypothetical protein
MDQDSKKRDDLLTPTERRILNLKIEALLAQIVKIELPQPNEANYYLFLPELRKELLRSLAELCLEESHNPYA